jgi:site-specific DNA-methyltransferase (adenine-specific)
MPHPVYVEWQRECLTEMVRLIKPNGVVFYNHKDRVQNGTLQQRRDITQGFLVRQIITWDRGSSLNINQGYFRPDTEQIYMVVKERKGFKIRKPFNSLSNVWYVQPERGTNKHPAPFPLQIAQRCLMAHPDPCVVLDPFGGSGTVAVAAMGIGADYILIEKSAEYCKMAQERLSSDFVRNLYETT